MKTRKISIAAIIAAAILVPLAIAQATSTTTIIVTPTNLAGWAFQTDGTASAQFVNGPGTPPLGSGSVEFKVGVNGDSDAEIRQTGFAGTKLSNLTELSYSTFVQQFGS